MRLYNVVMLRNKQISDFITVKVWDMANHYEVKVGFCLIIKDQNGVEKEQRFMESSNYNRELHNLENLLGYIGQKISYLLKELEKVIESKIASVPTDDGYCSHIPFTEWRLEKLMYKKE